MKQRATEERNGLAAVRSYEHEWGPTSRHSNAACGNSHSVTGLMPVAGRIVSVKEAERGLLEVEVDVEIVQ